LNSRPKIASAALVVPAALVVDQLEFHAAPSQAFDRRAHDHVAPLGARHRAAHQQQLPVGVDAHHHEIGNGSLDVAQMPRHALAGKHASRILVLARRARLVVRDGVAVRGAVGREMVALDDAREALADGHALHVHLLPDLEQVDADLAAHLEVRQVLGAGAELLEHVPRLDAALARWPASGLRTRLARRLPKATCTAA
jgi:hypothetical protein